MSRRKGQDHRRASGPSPTLSRRELLQTAAGAGIAAVLPGCLPEFASDRGLTAAVAILRARYSDDLANTIETGFQLVPPPDVAGKTVLLKVNLVDLPREGKPIVTDPAVIVAAAEAFRRRGAAEVLVADGPALQRDAWQIVDAIGLTPLLAEHGLSFIDLNTADLTRQPNARGGTGRDYLYFAQPVCQADVLVSMPKMKTHHWAGVSLALKNMFGTLSGMAYGMPRNTFHLGNLSEAILDCNAARLPDYAILDGIVGLEGDGPVRGTPIDVGVLVLADNPLAADATAARVMGIRPERIDYLRLAAGQLGPLAESSIQQRAESIASTRTPFQLLQHQLALVL